MREITPADRTVTQEWREPDLMAQMQALLPGIEVNIVAELDSTNSALVDRARISAAGMGVRADNEPSLGRRSYDFQPVLLVAEHQRRGRGRIGRHWQSQRGASLTFSLLLPLAPVDWSGLSLAVGSAVAEALDPPSSAHPPRLLLKWPNDLWLRDRAAPLGGRKLGGILIESVPVAGRRMCIIGVGLNLAAQAAQDLATGFASWSEIEPDTTAPAVLHRVAPALVRAIKQFEAQGFGAVAEAFACRDLLAGSVVQTMGAETLTGTAEGVDARGALRLLLNDGRRVLINSGEVSIRPVGPHRASGLEQP
jgi:BirA family biotin operon repressor/biotin-[acetyl-CoA-carboxylase] ligase